MKHLDLTRVVFSDEEVLPLELHWTRAEQSDLGGRGSRKNCTKGRSRSRCVHQRAQPVQPRHHGGRRDCERHRFPAVLHRRGYPHQHRTQHSDAGRRVFATLHGAPWHRHVELVVAGRQTLHHTPAGAPRRFLKEREIQLLTWPPCPPDLSPLDFHLWQEWKQRLAIVNSRPSLSCAP